MHPQLEIAPFDRLGGAGRQRGQCGKAAVSRFGGFGASANVVVIQRDLEGGGLARFEKLLQKHLVLGGPRTAVVAASAQVVQPNLDKPRERRFEADPHLRVQRFDEPNRPRLVARHEGF